MLLRALSQGQNPGIGTLLTAGVPILLYVGLVVLLLLVLIMYFTVSTIEKIKKLDGMQARKSHMHPHVQHYTKGFRAKSVGDFTESDFIE